MRLNGQGGQHIEARTVRAGNPAKEKPLAGVVKG